MTYRTISFVIILLFSLSIFTTISTGMLGKKIATAIAAIAPDNKTTLLPNSINSTEEKKFQSHSGIPHVEISKDIAPFSQGTVDYGTRIDRGYRGSTSSHIELATTANHHLSLAIYHNDSSYTPNSYLLLQSDNNGKSHFDQRPLNQTIEYGKWYKVRLKINSTAISFYFDGKPITTLSRLTGNASSSGSSNSSDAYTSIRLIGESAAVSFKNMVIEQNNQFSGIQGYGVVRVDPQTIVVTHPQEKSLVLANYDKYTQLLKEIYFPDGTVALDIFKIIRHERLP